MERAEDLCFGGALLESGLLKPTSQVYQMNFGSTGWFSAHLPKPGLKALPEASIDRHQKPNLVDRAKSGGSILFSSQAGGGAAFSSEDGFFRRRLFSGDSPAMAGLSCLKKE